MISTLLFGQAMCPFYTFFSGCVSMYNVITKLDNMIENINTSCMKVIRNFTFRWVGAILGQQLPTNTM